MKLFILWLQENERLVYRIQRVRKLLKRTRKEKKLVQFLGYILNTITILFVIYLYLK